MTKFLISCAAVAALAAAAGTANASLRSEPLAGPAVQAAAMLQFAKNGADDPAGHDRNDDHGGKASNGGKGRGGKDDGPRHT